MPRLCQSCEFRVAFDRSHGSQSRGTPFSTRCDSGWTTSPTSDTGNPGESNQNEVRYLDIYEDDPFDEAQFAAWVKQVSQLPGERM